MMAGQEIEPRPHWWKASALTTVPTLLTNAVAVKALLVTKCLLRFHGWRYQQKFRIREETICEKILNMNKITDVVRCLTMHGSEILPSRQMNTLNIKKLSLYLLKIQIRYFQQLEASVRKRVLQRAKH